MSILIFQILIVASIFIIARALPRALMLATLAWTVVTLVFIYTAPLMLLQLLTIWGSYWKFSPAWRQAGNIPSTLRAEVRAGLNAFVDQIATQQVVVHTLHPLRAAIQTEQLVIEKALESAQQQLRLNQRFDREGPEFKAQYDQSYAHYTQLLKPVPSAPFPSVLLPNFDAIPRPDSPQTAETLEQEIRTLREGRNQYLDMVRRTLRADARLNQLFERQLRKRNAVEVWTKEFSPLQVIRSKSWAQGPRLSPTEREKVLEQLLAEAKPRVGL